MRRAAWNVHAPGLNSQGDHLGDDALTRAHLVFEWAHVDEHGVNHKRELVAINHTEYVRTANGWKIRHRVTIPYSITDSSRCGCLHDIRIPDRY